MHFTASMYPSQQNVANHNGFNNECHLKNAPLQTNPIKLEANSHNSLNFASSSTVSAASSFLFDHQNSFFNHNDSRNLLFNQSQNHPLSWNTADSPNQPIISHPLFNDYSSFFSNTMPENSSSTLLNLNGAHCNDSIFNIPNTSIDTQLTENYNSCNYSDSASNCLFQFQQPSLPHQHQQHQQPLQQNSRSITPFQPSSYVESYPTNAHSVSGGGPYIYTGPDPYQPYYQYQGTIPPAPPTPQPHYTTLTNHTNHTNLTNHTNSTSNSPERDLTVNAVHPARAAPETINWLLENYEFNETSSLQRCTLYNHYLKHCAEHSIEPINPASFGKLIRSVFEGLKTRRLGTRGNSKYHYYGIRIKAESKLNGLLNNESNSENIPVISTRAMSTRATTAANSLQSNNNNINNPRRLETVEHASSLGRRSSASDYSTTSTTSTNILSKSDNNILMEEEDIDVIIDDLQIIVDVDADINVDVVEEDNHVVIEKEHVLRLEEVSVVVEPNADPILVSDPEIVAGITLLTLSSGATEETVVVPENLLVNTVNQYEEIKKDLIAGSNAETIMTPLVKGAMEINSWPIGDRKMGFIEPPFFLDLEEQSEYGELNERLIIKFVTNYLNHCQEMLDTIKQLNFNNVYDTLVSFWQNEIEDDLPEPMENQDLTIPAEEDVQVVVEPSVHATSILNKICSIPEIQKYMICVDLEFYQSVLETLIPNVLRGEMNQTITALFDLFGKKIVDDLSALLIDFDVTFKANKLNTARLFSQTLDRYVSINRLVYALRTVTENSASVEQMYTDFCSLDMEVIHARANFVCGSDSTIVTNIEHSFESGLKNNKSVEDWSEWIEAVIDQSMASCHDKSFKESVEHAKQFILKWTYHTTMILRKLMLNMAASYASFDLLKSFFDEIVPHMLEQKLAKIKNVPSISINLCNQSDSYYYVEHFKFKTSANDEKGTLKKRIYRKRAASALSKEKKATVSKGINKKKPSKLNNIENNKNINANKAV